VITIETTDAAVRVTIPKDEVPADRLNSILDWLRLEAVAQRNALSEADAQHIAETMKASWWAANKDQFIKPAGQ